MQRSKVGEKWGELSGNVEGGANQPVNMHRHVHFMYCSVQCWSLQECGIATLQIPSSSLKSKCRFKV